MLLALNIPVYCAFINHTGVILLPVEPTPVILQSGKVTVEIKRNSSLKKLGNYQPEYECHLTGVYQLVNPTGNQIDLEAGIFIPRMILPRNGWYQVRFGYDNLPLPAEFKRLEHTFYSGITAFKKAVQPGITVISVDYVYPSNGRGIVDAGFIVSGLPFWGGSMDSLEIQFGFEEPVSSGQIHSIDAGYEKINHHFQWTIRDYDGGYYKSIRIAFMGHEDFSQMESLQEQIRKNPDNADLQIDYALKVYNTYFSCNYRLNKGFHMLERLAVKYPASPRLWKNLIRIQHSGGISVWKGIKKSGLVRLIRKAHRYCPDDPQLSRLYELIEPDGKVLPAYIEVSKSQGVWQSKITYADNRWHNRNDYWTDYGWALWYYRLVNQTTYDREFVTSTGRIKIIQYTNYNYQLDHSRLNTLNRKMLAHYFRDRDFYMPQIARVIKKFD